jgi:hypothetical protein
VSQNRKHIAQVKSAGRGDFFRDAVNEQNRTAADAKQAFTQLLAHREPMGRRVYAVGTIVKIGPKDGGAVGSIDGEIVAVCIYRDHIQYQVAWWDERARKTEWLHEHEVSADSDYRLDRIGFHTPGTIDAQKNGAKSYRLWYEEMLSALAAPTDKIATKLPPAWKKVIDWGQDGKLLGYTTTVELFAEANEGDAN